MLAQEPAPPPGPPPSGGLPLVAAADLQDHLMVATNDLDRLQRLLDDATQQLMGHFTCASRLLEAAGSAGPAQDLGDARASLGGAITALQFQDMASQLIAHTTRRLRNCADRIAQQALADLDDDADGAAVVEELPLRPNPVTQDEMDAGSIELF
jgi:hypothetical protein